MGQAVQIRTRAPDVFGDLRLEIQLKKCPCTVSYHHLCFTSVNRDLSLDLRNFFPGLPSSLPGQQGSGTFAAMRSTVSLTESLACVI